jgi:hypothetical protein
MAFFSALKITISKYLYKKNSLKITMNIEASFLFKMFVPRKKKLFRSQKSVLSCIISKKNIQNNKNNEVINIKNYSNFFLLN